MKTYLTLIVSAVGMAVALAAEDAPKTAKSSAMPCMDVLGAQLCRPRHRTWAGWKERL